MKKSNSPNLLKLPEHTNKLLLHTCCAPCSCAIIENLQIACIDFTILYYNPNIHPEKEYLIRKEENKKFAQKLNVNFIDADYEPSEWFSALEYESLKQNLDLSVEPERGNRCFFCFYHRFAHVAEFALKNNFDVFTSSLIMSRKKDLEQINTCGQKIANQYLNLTFWDLNWRKDGRTQRMAEISKEEKFYRQTYCGCIYSR